MSITGLPNELLLEIGELLLLATENHESIQVPSWSSLSSTVFLASTCRQFRAIFLPFSCRRASKIFPSLLFWACDRGHARLVDELLVAGADPNRALYCSLFPVHLAEAPLGQRPLADFHDYDNAIIP